MAVGDFIRGSQVWKSIFRHPAPRDRRNRVVVMLTNVFLHLHPVSVRQSGIALSYTWCMGGLTFFLFLVETVTGVLLMFYYRPTLEHAYNDILAVRYAGRGNTLFEVGDVPLIHPGGDARFLLLRNKFVSGETLLRFYVLHCVAIPLAAALLIAVHFWRLRKDGGVSGPL